LSYLLIADVVQIPNIKEQSKLKGQCYFLSLMVLQARRHNYQRGTMEEVADPEIGSYNIIS
jgi:hypothetical protein